MGDDNAAAFVARWSAVTGSERANYQLFVTELCALLGVPLPGRRATGRPISTPGTPAAPGFSSAVASRNRVKTGGR